MPRHARVRADKDIAFLFQIFAHVATSNDNPNSGGTAHDWDASGGWKPLTELLRKVQIASGKKKNCQLRYS